MDSSSVTRHYMSGVTRPSCIHCVQKHIGGAEVLITEMRDGYKYMTRAVGEMYQAEDESQDWGDLHNLIRDYRTAYQTHLIMPNWEKLNNSIIEILTQTRNEVKNG